MQDYRKIDIRKEEILSVSEKMRSGGIPLVMIHGFINKENQPVISYDYAVGTAVEAYTVTGETVFPTISGIYDTAAEWPERELNELFGWTFEGLDVSRRLFLPEDMLETQGKGQIMVKPLEELRKLNSVEKKPEEKKEEDE